MTDILGDQDFDQIRWAIDLTMDDVMLPANIIRQPIYQFAGEAQVKARVPDWAARLALAGDDATHLRSAAIYYVAALLCPAIPVIKSEVSSEGQRYDRDIIKWSDLAGELQSRGDGELAYVISAGESTAEKPVMFAVATGRRGR